MKSKLGIEERIGLTFKDKRLLQKSLTHRSYLNERGKALGSNERLEFLGDAILEFVVSEHIFQRFPDQEEGYLTAVRSKLVNTISLAATARELRIGGEIYMSRGEESGGGKDRSGLLADTVEALIGAIFIDQGIEKVKEFITRFIIVKIPEVTKNPLKDPKSRLQELAQAAGFRSPSYRTLSQKGPDHERNFTIEVWIKNKVYGQGSGLSKQIAQQKAAEEALKEWNKGT
ncbi:ribonuclease III [Candidatus Woesebacteria bacterium]|nr:ribonuclease III [Candidatus Woesebacteria bacterium]